MSDGMPDVKFKVIVDPSGAIKPLQDVNDKLRDNAKAAKETGQATADAGLKFGQLGSTVGLVGQTVGRFNTGLGQTITTGASALGSIQAMGTLGFGPLGLVIGVASTALTLFASRSAAAEEKTRTLTTALDANARSLTAVIAKMREQAQLEAQTARLAAGGGSEEEYRAEALRLRERRGQIREQFGGTAAGRAADARIYDQIQRAQERADAVRAGGGAADEVTIDIEEGATLTGQAARDADPRNPRRRRGGGSGGRTAAGATDATAAAANAQAEKAREFAAQAAEERRAEEDAQTELAQKGIDARLEAQRAATDQSIEDEERRVEGVRRAIDREMEARRESAQELTEIQDTLGAAFQVMNDAIQAAAESSGASAETQKKIMAGAALAEAIVQGAIEVARAAASYPDFVGMATHGIAAAAYAVAAVKAGGSMGSSAAPAGAARAPTGGPSSSGGDGGRRGGDVYNISMGNGALVTAGTHAEVARELRRLMSDTRLSRGA